ncbi:Glycosyltransferase [Acanthopleuribacter pedis]
MPVYNGMPYLPEAVAAVQAQRDCAFECVVVNDGSEDGTAAYLDQIAREDPRFRVFHAPHGGIVAALNLGLTHVRADWIARMDADDQCAPDRLARQARFLQAHPEIGLVAARVAYDGDAERNRGFALYVDWSNELCEPEMIWLNRFVESPLVHPSVMFRRDCVARFGGYRDGAFPEDYELWLRWLDAGVKMSKLPEVLVSWREREDRLTRVHERYTDLAFYRAKALYLQRFLSRHLKNKPRPIWVWGAGRTTRKRAKMLEENGLTIASYIDINPKKIGQTIDEKPVVAPAAIPEPARCFVLAYVGSRGAREQIAAFLEEKGFRAGRDYLLAA